MRCQLENATPARFWAECILRAQSAPQVRLCEPSCLRESVALRESALPFRLFDENRAKRGFCWLWRKKRLLPKIRALQFAWAGYLLGYTHPRDGLRSFISEWVEESCGLQPQVQGLRRPVDELKDLGSLGATIAPVSAHSSISNIALTTLLVRVPCGKSTGPKIFYAGVLARGQPARTEVSI